MTKDIIQKHIFISGRVQGVGFRAFTRQKAASHGIKGWVKNLADGRVEIKIQGDKENIKDMIKRIKEGPSFARVDDVEVKDEQIEDFDRFEVRF